MPRNRVPTQIKKLRGTLQPCRVLENEVVLSQMDAIPVPPDKLNDDGKEVWYALCAEALRLGMLSAIGLPQITRYCIYWQLFCYHLANVLENDTKAVEEYGNGNRGMSADFKAMNESVKWMERFEVQWGLTPSASARVAIPKKEEEINEFVIR